MSHVTWFEARELTFAAGQASSRRGTQQVALADAIGATLAQDALSPISLPHYASSAMDGFAVSGSSPWQILYPEEAKDSHENIHGRTVTLEQGQATPILTGGLVPDGATAVVRVEHTHYDDNAQQVLLPNSHDPEPGADIRPAGEEITAGDVLVESGTVLSPRHIALLAVSGIDEVTIARRPSIACAFTGNEVIERGIPAPGEVRDAYAPQFPHVLKQMGAGRVATARLHDDMAEVASFFASTDADIILATGGSANSEVDILRRYLEEQNARFIFESILVRPGHPTLLAELADGRLVLGLPGNPLAAHTSLYALVPVLLAAWSGRELPELASAPALTAVPGFTKTSTRILPCHVNADGATIFTRATNSHMLSALAAGNALAVVPPSGIDVGENVCYLSVI